MKDKMSTKEIPHLMGRNNDKDLKLNYVMATTRKVTSAVT